MNDYKELRSKYILTGERICQALEVLEKLSNTKKNTSECWLYCSWETTSKIRFTTSITEPKLFGSPKIKKQSFFIWASVCSKCGKQQFFSQIENKNAESISKQEFDKKLSELISISP